MHRNRKPVRKCYSCLLNLGDHCWCFEFPHDRWRRALRCPGFQNERLYRLFREWRKLPRIRTGKEMRQEVHRKPRRPPEYVRVELLDIR